MTPAPDSKSATATAPAQAPAAAQNNFRVVPADTSQLVKPHSITKGPANARVTLVEYLDPECESCARMNPYVKKIVKEFEKDLRVVVRYMPYHGNSKLVANILEGARAEGKYWETLDILFETQSQWANHHQPRPDLIPEILKPLGLNMKKIMADAQAGKFDQLIMEDAEDGKNLGVNGTPTFFVNGSKLEELGYEPLRLEIQKYLR